MSPSAPDRLHRPYRWAVLAAYTVALGVTQMLWLNFAPLLALVQKRFGVSELEASALILVFPLLYVLLSLPAGALIDRRGYRFTVGLGAVATAAFAALRIWDASFAVILAGQIGIAVAQPFVVNGISKLVADWFDETQGAIATGLGTMGMFLGMALGMATTPALEEAIGLRGTLAVFAAIAAAAALAFVWVARVNDAPGAVAAPVEERGYGPLLRNRRLLLFFGIAFLGLGVFNGLTTWLEEILAPQGIDATTAGLVGGVLIVGGIVGAVVIPLLSDKLRRRKPFLLLSATAAALCVWPLCTGSSVPGAIAVAGALGFFFMPAFALLLDMSAQVAGAARAGGATSLLMMCGNGGGVLVIVAVPLLKDWGGSHRPAIAMFIGLLAIAVVLVALGPETMGRAPSAPGGATS